MRLDFKLTQNDLRFLIGPRTPVFLEIRLRLSFADLLGFELSFKKIDEICDSKI